MAMNCTPKKAWLIVTASFEYFARVFLFAFFMGATRVVIFEPMMGEVYAVIAEVPLVVGISWRACRATISRYTELSQSKGGTIVMGFLSYVILIMAELLLAVYGANMTLHAFLDKQFYSNEAHHRIGMLGQILYGCFPFFQSLKLNKINRGKSNQE
jgi:hypothetical protein